MGTATLVLGQPDFITNTDNISASQNNLRLPSALASDGIHLVVADTYHNRVLIWNHIPTVNDAPADVVVGQANFTTRRRRPVAPPPPRSLRGPQGVWIQNGKLYVADTGYNRVLIYNHIPTQTAPPPTWFWARPTSPPISPGSTDHRPANSTTGATASNMLNPVSVTSDGTHLFVTDLGYNRVLIWNSIPTTNGAPADVVIGQPDMVSTVANNAFIGIAAPSRPTPPTWSAGAVHRRPTARTR